MHPLLAAQELFALEDAGAAWCAVILPGRGGSFVPEDFRYSPPAPATPFAVDQAGEPQHGRLSGRPYLAYVAVHLLRGRFFGVAFWLFGIGSQRYCADFMCFWRVAGFFACKQ